MHTENESIRHKHHIGSSHVDSLVYHSGSTQEWEYLQAYFDFISFLSMEKVNTWTLHKVASHLCLVEWNLNVISSTDMKCSTKTSWLFNHRVFTMVADKLKGQWLWEVRSWAPLLANCLRQPERQLPQFILQPQCTDNPQNICEGVITNALQSCSKELVTRWVNHKYYKAFQRIVVVRWTGQLPLSFLLRLVSITKANLS